MAQVEEAYAKARFGQEMAEIEELTELVGNAEAAVTVAREDRHGCWSTGRTATAPTACKCEECLRFAVHCHPFF